MAGPGVFYTFYFTAFSRGPGQSLDADSPNIKSSATTSPPVLGLADPWNAAARWDYLWYIWPRNRYDPCSHLGEVRGWGWWTVCFPVAVRDGGEVIMKQRHWGNCEVRRRVYNPLQILSQAFMPKQLRIDSFHRNHASCLQTKLMPQQNLLTECQHESEICFLSLQRED